MKREYIIIGLVCAIVLWVLMTSRIDKREGFQTSTASIIPQLESNPQTCAIFKAILERTQNNLQEAIKIDNKDSIQSLTDGVNSITSTMESLNCS